MALGDILAELPAPGIGDRVCFMGNSGEGKSELLIRLLASVPNVILVNSKGDPAFAKVGPTVREKEIYAYTEGRVNFTPSDEWCLSMDEKNRFFGWALTHARQLAGEGLVIAIDEVNDIAPSAQVYPIKFQKCIKQGRFIGLGIWCGSQEPVRAPSFAFGQSQHRYLFFLGWAHHRKVAEAWFELDIPWELMPERSHKFLLKTPRGIFGPMIVAL